MYNFSIFGKKMKFYEAVRLTTSGPKDVAKIILCFAPFDALRTLGINRSRP